MMNEKIEVVQVKDEWTVYINNVFMATAKGPCAAIIVGAFIKLFKERQTEGLIGIAFDYMKD